MHQNKSLEQFFCCFPAIKNIAPPSSSSNYCFKINLLRNTRIFPDKLFDTNNLIRFLSYKCSFKVFFQSFLPDDQKWFIVN